MKKEEIIKEIKKDIDNLKSLKAEFLASTLEIYPTKEELENPPL